MNRKTLIKALTMAVKLTPRAGYTKESGRDLAFLWQNGERARVVAFSCDHYEKSDDQAPRTVLIADVGPTAEVSCYGLYPRETLAALKTLTENDVKPDASKAAPLELGDVLYLACALGPAFEAWRTLAPTDQPAALYRHALRTVEHAMSGDVTCAHLSCINLSEHGGMLRAAATDGHRLARTDVSMPSAPQLSVDGLPVGRAVVSFLLSLLPRTVGSRFGLAIQAPQRQVKVTFKQVTTWQPVKPRAQACAKVTTLEAEERETSAPHHALYRLNGCDVVSRIDGILFPPYDQVIPRETTRTFTCDRAALLAEVRRLDLNMRNHGLAIEVNNSCATLSVDPEDKDGNIKPTVHGAVKGEWSNSAGFAGAFSIGVNARYLIDALEAVEGARVTVGFNGELDPIRIADAHTECVCMPMRK